MSWLPGNGRVRFGRWPGNATGHNCRSVIPIDTAIAFADPLLLTPVLATLAIPRDRATIFLPQSNIVKTTPGYDATGRSGKRLVRERAGARRRCLSAMTAPSTQGRPPAPGADKPAQGPVAHRSDRTGRRLGICHPLVIRRAIRPPCRFGRAQQRRRREIWAERLTRFMPPPLPAGAGPRPPCGETAGTRAPPRRRPPCPSEKRAVRSVGKACQSFSPSPAPATELRSRSIRSGSIMKKIPYGYSSRADMPRAICPSQAVLITLPWPAAGP